MRTLAVGRRPYDESGNGDTAAIVRRRNRISALAHKPGLLRTITRKLVQRNMDLFYLHATAEDVDKCLVVFSSANNARAALLW